VGNRSAIQDGVTGYVVNEARPAAFADCIQTLIEQPALRKKMGSLARSRAEREFDTPVMLANYQKNYKQGLSCVRTFV
jgi:glycosyltransferase involved in cell wall biosynthesis